MQRNKSIINPFNNKIWIFDEYQQPSINKGSIIMYIILTIDLMDDSGFTWKYTYIKSIYFTINYRKECTWYNRTLLHIFANLCKNDGSWKSNFKEFELHQIQNIIKVKHSNESTCLADAAIVGNSV